MIVVRHHNKLEIIAEAKNGDNQIVVDEKWISRERERIEDEYTYLVPRYGRIIFSRDRDAFQDEIALGTECWKILPSRDGSFRNRGYRSQGQAS